MINITGHTGLTGLLGSPVAHSVSPLMHNEAFRYLGLDYVYLCFDVTEETLPQAVEGLKACGIKGFNLTMPNKNKIVELLDQVLRTFLSPALLSSSTRLNSSGATNGPFLMLLLILYPPYFAFLCLKIYLLVRFLVLRVFRPIAGLPQGVIGPG